MYNRFSSVEYTMGNQDAGKTSAASNAANRGGVNTISGVRPAFNPPVGNSQEAKGRDPKSLDNKANQSNPNHMSYWKCRGYDVDSQDHVNFLNSKAQLGTLKGPEVFNAYKSNLKGETSSKKPKTAPASMASIPVPQKNFSGVKKQKVNFDSTVHFAKSIAPVTSSVVQKSGIQNQLRAASLTRKSIPKGIKQMAKIPSKNLPQGMAATHKVFQKIVNSVKRGQPKYSGKMGGNHAIYQNVDLRDPKKLGENVRRVPSIKSVFGPFGEGKMLPGIFCKETKFSDLKELLGLPVFAVDENMVVISLGVMDEKGNVLPDSSCLILASEPMQDRHVSDLLEDYGGKKRVEKLERDVSSLRMVKMNESRELQDVIRDEVFVKRVKYMWILNALLPELYENIGIPDQFNSSASIFPTLVTRFLCTFATIAEQTRCCAVIVQEDMQDLIRVLGQGGDQTIEGTGFQNLFPGQGGSQWMATPYNQGGKSVIYENAGSYLIDTLTSLFYINFQTYRSTALDATIQVEKVNIGGADYYYVPVDTGSTFAVRASTPDTTANGYTSTCSFITRTGGTNGTLAIVTSAPVNGTGDSARVAFNHTPPADSIGVYAFTVTNAAAGTVSTISPCVVSTQILADPADLVVGIGKSDGSDIAFFKQFCSELRMVSMSVRGMPYCSALGNLLFTGGQFLDSESDTIVSPTFQNWSANQLFFMKQMVNGSMSGFEFPILKRDYATVNFYNLDSEDEDRVVERGGVWLQGVSDESDYVALEIYNGIQGHPILGIQALDAKPGICCEEALDEGNTFLNEHRLKFDNDDHVAECEKLAKESVTNNYTLSLFNGNSFKDIVA